MDHRLIVLVFIGTLVRVTFAQTRQYYFVNTALNWTDAQSFCRRNYTDLATIKDITDVEAVNLITSGYRGFAWIGLYDDLVNSWKWSLNEDGFYGDGETMFRNWYTDQPNNLDGLQHCVIILSGSSYSGKWGDQECNESKQFVCYNGTVGGSPSYIISNTSLKWAEAQAFCRENYVDLASVRNQSENDIISSLGNGLFLWIGLSREKLWSDGSASLFRNWAANQPNNGSHECMVANFNDSGKWHDQNCPLTFPFVCYKPIPPNAVEFRVSTQDLTSITLKWNKINSNISFIFQFNGMETFINSPDGDGPVTHTESSLSAGTKYTFALFSVLDNVRSSGVGLTAATVPLNAEGLRLLSQTETSITLQWNKLNNSTGFVLQFNGTERIIGPPDGDGPITHEVSPLDVGKKYSFTLLSVIENIRSSGVQLSAVTVPRNTYSFGAYSRDETSITLQWDKINGNTSFVLQFNGTERNISAPDEDRPITHTVVYLTAGTRYTFTLFSVFENVRSRGLSITERTVPQKPEGFTAVSQNETSITLQWNRTINNDSFYHIHFEYGSIYVRAPDGSGPITHTVQNLYAGTRYTFSLHSIFDWILSSRATTLFAVTVPRNPDNFRPSTQDETSITLQWDKISNSVSYILWFNGTETHIGAPTGSTPVTHTVSSLTGKSKYTFLLFSVIDNIRSSGVNITATTGPNHIIALNMELESYGALSESQIQALVAEFFTKYGLLPQFSMRVVSDKP